MPPIFLFLQQTATVGNTVQGGIGNAPIPARTATDTLLLATWNIREFDSCKYGYRPEEPHYYLAEIL